VVHIKQECTPHKDRKKEKLSWTCGEVRWRFLERRFCDLLTLHD